MIITFCALKHTLYLFRSARIVSIKLVNVLYVIVCVNLSTSKLLSEQYYLTLFKITTTNNLTLHSRLSLIKYQVFFFKYSIFKSREPPALFKYLRLDKYWPQSSLECCGFVEPNDDIKADTRCHNRILMSQELQADLPLRYESHFLQGTASLCYVRVVSPEPT